VYALVEDNILTKASVAILRAADGKIVATTPLTATRQGLQPYVSCPTCMALDPRSDRLLVLGEGLNTPDHSSTSGYVFVLNAVSGRLLAAVALGPNDTTQAGAENIVVDERTNRVFSTSEATNTLSVLDATTGKLLHTVTCHNAGPDAEAVEPLGVDSRDGGVLVQTPDGGLAMVDERTGALLRYLPLPGAGLGANPPAVVDSLRGRAVVSVAGPPPTDDPTPNGDSYAIATIDLSNGKVIGVAEREENNTLPLILDARTGTALLYVNPAPNVDTYLPATVDALDDATGQATAGVSVAALSACSGVGATVNPLTGHALLVQAVGGDDGLGATSLLVENLHTGAQLAALSLPGVREENQVPSVVVDAPTRHVFVASPAAQSIFIYDATKL
jgi:DNA-binding beta-propeller fold protein YncE